MEDEIPAVAEHDRRRDRRQQIDEREVIPFSTTVCWFAARFVLTSSNWRWLTSSRVYAWTTRIPAMSSASVAVTRPSRSRTCPYAREERLRNQRVASGAGITVMVASASRQSSGKRMTAVPTSVSVFLSRLATPSVTS